TYNSNNSFLPSNNNISEDTSNANKYVFNVNKDNNSLDTNATDTKDLKEDAKLNIFRLMFKRAIGIPT
ncbi:hypothetical protein CTA1_9432, partial [Colletotrichum tanaceti]